MPTCALVVIGPEVVVFRTVNFVVELVRVVTAAVGHLTGGDVTLVRSRHPEAVAAVNYMKSFVLL